MVNIINSLKLSAQEKEDLQTLGLLSLNQVVPVLYKFQKRHPHLPLSPFFTIPKESERSFEEWCKGFLKLTSLLEEANQSVQLLNIMKYLACCDEGSPPDISFELMVEDFYQEYGFAV